MKRSTKIWLTVAFACIAAGIAVTVFAFSAWGIDVFRMNDLLFEEKTVEVSEEFKNIAISGTECDVLLALSEDGKCRVVTKDAEKIVTSVNVENDTLSVKRTDIRRWYEHIGIWFEKDLTITVYLPEDSYGELILETVSGNISIGDSFTFEKAAVSSTSGDISFSAATENGLSVNSTSGDVFAKNALGGAVNAKTTSGDLTLCDITVSELKAETVSGDIALSRIISDGKADIQAVSGDIEFQKLDAGKVVLEAVSGDIEGTFLSPKNFDTDTVSGDIRIPVSSPDGALCSVKTTSGDIEISIEPKKRAAKSLF